MNEQKQRIARRRVLASAVAGGAALALTAGTARASTRQGGFPPGQVPGVSTVIDSSHATPEVTALLERFFRAKSARDVNATMSFFAKQPMNYLDATLGLDLTWDTLRALFAKAMPTWPASGSYATRILGDETSALVVFTNIPGLFGPSEIRSISTVNFKDGLVHRWLDQWDGRHFGLANLATAQSPQNQFPTDWKESTVGETAAATMQHTVHALTEAAGSGDRDALTAVLASDVVLEDNPAHLRIVGQRSVSTFFIEAAGVLPYAGPGTGVRHVVGSAIGGGYEWTSTASPVPRGVSAVELDDAGRVTRLTAMWDGSLADATPLTKLAQLAIEQ
jgi:hypothetical protein